MSIKKILLGAALAVSAVAPTVASAQYYDGYDRGYEYRHDGDRYDHARRDWRARERWERYRAEEARREYWARQHHRFYGDYDRW